MLHESRIGQDVMKNMNEKGNVAIIICLAMVALCGFAAYAIDIGLVYTEKARLSNGIDSAVLAAALELPSNSSKARTIALQYLNNNNISQNEVAISISTDNKSIQIDGTKTVNHLFAPIIGINSSNIFCSSAATIAPLKAVSGGIRPFAVEYYDFNYGQLVTLKTGAGSTYHGNYGVVALGGQGSTVFLQNALYGYKGTINIGDYIDTEPGNMAGAVNTISNYINSENSTFNNFPRNSIRLWTIPIVSTLEVNGRKPVLDVGFGEFYVESVGNNSGKMEISGRFVRYVREGEVDINAKDTGAYGVKLVR
jgi:Flp pilus assembly protein TadG